MIDLAIIPARSGSKGLPEKNILDLGGVPLIAWTIKAALASGVFKRVIVTTDDPTIADKSKMYGAEIPFIRPLSLASSYSKSSDVISHALDAVSACGTFAFLQPTSPFRSSVHLIDAATKYLSSSSSSLVSIVHSKPLHWQFKIDEFGYIVPIVEDFKSVYRRQDAISSFALNGAIYMCEVEEFRNSGSLINNQTIGYEMSSIDSVDIDLEDDLLFARAIVNDGLRGID